MPTRPVVLVCLVAALACGTAERGPGAAVPASITPAWYVVNFPNCVDRCEDEERSRLWLAIRDRPDLVDALVHVIESPITDAWTRANAILRLGATGQERAQRYIQDRLESLPVDDPDASSWILALGSGQGPVPDAVYQTLARQLLMPYRADTAIFTLGEIGTAQARSLLEGIAATAADPALRESIQRALREWTPRPEREPR